MWEVDAEFLIVCALVIIVIAIIDCIVMYTKGGDAKGRIVIYLCLLLAVIGVYCCTIFVVE